MSSAREGNCTELRPTTDRALRSENICLRGMLDTANEVAAHYPVLLREGNHRIKNSLQVVSSLLSLQAGREESSSARAALDVAAARIQAVASMHDALQASEGHNWIDLGVALEIMCRSLQNMGGIASGVDVRVEREAVHTPVDFAQPVLLAVNELVLNALRHAFPDGRCGSIVVKLGRAGGQLHVVVADDGVGLPAGYTRARGFGMKLVRMMTDKIKGALHIDSGAGTRIAIVSAEPQVASPAQGLPALWRMTNAKSAS